MRRSGNSGFTRWVENEIVRREDQSEQEKEKRPIALGGAGLSQKGGTKTVPCDCNYTCILAQTPAKENK